MSGDIDLLIACPGSHLYQTAIAQASSQLHFLVDWLERIFMVVQPGPESERAFGHEIRNLLIIACTEVEAQWTSILRANGAVAVAGRFSTQDYVKLLPVMRLHEYSVRFRQVPWLDPVAPFRDWVSARPTQSLAWYDAYNQVKHDRESNLNYAQLRHAISAVMANLILTWAQWGEGSVWLKDIPVRFWLQDRPQWRVGSYYVQANDRHRAPTDPARPYFA